LKIALIGEKKTLKPYFPLEDSSRRCEKDLKFPLEDSSRRCEKDLETLFTSSSHTYTRYY
jgi:hypothetical protein